jgi:hypothetical protein
MLIRRFDILLGKAEVGQQIKPRLGQRFPGNLEGVEQELLTQCPLICGKLDVKCGLEGPLEFLQGLIREALALERGMVDRGRLSERAVPNGIGFISAISTPL